MTKPRTPDSFEDAAAVAAGRLGFDRMGKTAGLKSGTWPRKWSDPEQDGVANLLQALMIDAACVSHPDGFGQPPFLTAYKRQLGALTEGHVAAGDLLSEALDVPAAVGHLMESLSAARSAASPGGIKISAAEARRLAATVKEIRDELDQFAAALDAQRAGP